MFFVVFNESTRSKVAVQVFVHFVFGQKTSPKNYVKNPNNFEKLKHIVIGSTLKRQGNLKIFCQTKESDKRVALSKNS